MTCDWIQYWGGISCTTRFRSKISVVKEDLIHVVTLTLHMYDHSMYTIHVVTLTLHMYDHNMYTIHVVTLTLHMYDHNMYTIHVVTLRSNYTVVWVFLYDSLPI
jgi:ABC-type uncharacterized transport system substrate-binding protein